MIFYIEKNWTAVSSCCFLQIDHVGSHKCSLCTHARTFAQRNCIIYGAVSLALELESEFCFLFFPAEALCCCFCCCCCCKVFWRQFYSTEFSLQRAAYYQSIHLFSVAWALKRDIFWKLLCLMYNNTKHIDIHWQFISGPLPRQGWLSKNFISAIAYSKILLAWRGVVLKEATVLKSKVTKWWQANSCPWSFTWGLRQPVGWSKPMTNICEFRIIDSFFGIWNTLKVNRSTEKIEAEGHFIILRSQHNLDTKST